MAERVEVLITGDASGLIRTTDQASAAMADFGRSAGKLSGIADALRSDFGRMTGAFAAAQVGVSAVIGAFNQAAAAVQAMNAEVIDAERVASKLIAVFDGAEGAAARLTAQAEALAGSTVFFDDDAIKSAAAALRAFDLTEQEISRLLPAAVNLATVFGTDLDSAAQKLALGLNGSTRGLREFGIVVKEGSDRSDVFAQILERGEKAAKGAADAQGGLRGATEGLKKAQGEFNQAIGNLLAGPQSALLNFLTDATNRATGLANSMAGATEQLIKTARVIDPLTGKIVEAQAKGGKDLFGPGSLTAQFAGKTTPASSASPVKQAEAAARVTKKAADDTARIQAEAIRREDDRIAFERRLLEDRIAANEAQIIKDGRAAQEIIDNFDAANRKRNEATVKAAEEAASLFSQGVTAAGRFFVDLIAGKASAGGLIRGFSSIAGALGFAAGGPVGGAAAGAATEIAAAIADQIAGSQARLETAQGMRDQVTLLNTLAATASSQLDRERYAKEAQVYQARLLEAERLITEENDKAARMQLEAAQVNKIAAEQSRINQQYAEAATRQERIAALKGPFEQFKLQFDQALGRLVDPTGRNQQTNDYINRIRTKVGGMGQEDLKRFGAMASGIFNADGSINQDALSSFSKALGLEPGAVQEEAVIGFAEFFRNLPKPGAPGTEDMVSLGDTPRNPLYVFDVTPSRDEFTRAPRGLFFRPVGSGRGVDGGQALSGVSSNTTNRAMSRRTG